MNNVKRFIFYLFNGLFIYALMPSLVFAQDKALKPISILTPPAVQNGTDLSISYLESIFGVVDGVLHGSGTQIMGQMFGILNTAALALGGIIIIFTMMVSTLNTAQEGEIMGRKWSSIWIPVRSATGIALLLPKASGYSVIQIFMMWVIVQGVGVADTMWDNVLNYLHQGGVIVAPAIVTDTANNVASAQIFDAEVCMYGLQAVLQKTHNEKLKAGESSTPPPLLINTVIPIRPQDGDTIYFPGKRLVGDYKDLVGVCGTMTWQKDTGGDAKTINGYKQTALQQMILDTSGAAMQVVNTLFDVDKNRVNDLPFFPDPKVCSKVGDTGISDGKPQPNLFLCRLFSNTAQDYQGIMRTANNLKSRKGDEAFIAKAKRDGWILAGNYFMQLTNLNNSVSSVQNAIKTYMEPQAKELTTRLEDKFKQSNISKDYATSIATLYSDAKNFSSRVPVIQPRVTGKSEGMTHKMQVINQTLGAAVAIAVAAVALAGPLGLLIGAILIPTIKIIVAFGMLSNAVATNLNPITTLASVGQGMVELATVTWVTGSISAAVTSGALSAVPFMALGNIANTIFIWLAPLLSALAIVLFVNGMVLMYYLPLIPFLIFIFAAIGWFIAVIEAMVAAPIIALGITHPEGHEIVGRADPAILLLVNVFLRPGLMIIGFIAGIILTYIGIWLFNEGFFPAFYANSKNISAIGYIFYLPAIIMIYTIAVIAILNQAFTLIHVVPDKILRWIGGSPDMAGAEAARALGELKSGFEGGSRSTGEGTARTSDAAGKRADKRTAKAEGKGRGNGDRGGDDASVLQVGSGGGGAP